MVVEPEERIGDQSCSELGVLYELLNVLSGKEGLRGQDDQHISLVRTALHFVRDVLFIDPTLNGCEKVVALPYEPDLRSLGNFACVALPPRSDRLFEGRLVQQLGDLDARPLAISALSPAA
jgi:hypothetical protein